MGNCSYTCNYMLRRFYLNACVRFLGGHVLRICENSSSYKNMFIRCTCTDAPTRGNDYKPKDARARVFTELCALAPAHGPRPGTRTPTQTCFTDASGALPPLPQRK